MSNGHTVTVQGLGERLPVERPEDCVSRTLSASGAGLVAGGIMGAVTANWGKVPPVLADRPWPALKHTGAIMGAYGTTFALVGGTFAVVDCLVEDFRGKKDAWNGVIAGLAAGAAIGMRVGRVPVGVGAAVALAATSAAVDVSGGHLVGNGFVNDGATPHRPVYPYK
ncbi:mitochondrial import inner membrane translocase, subunit Tim17/22 [Coccomyxa subellipsoidea C-169]|uniref:Mitochondrial import inner membrane translocase, subunit Tim17/22 n=1 Tax=Coccomyxa subellipsoidea (strain C-169) TaxID=574566 RepID=I0YXC0_COCSC|nr:mitochondrial import inner membrane translocase, subunit Tim17/22 [Coccomyxa subellipsoidea C-169]EIE23039.1 mitochondrial import inner membrane translocase, subunit Tim17/22 [Coccomyxa subellipsoidea C-169]|eukprot:XP_005647583.1 mitochondrial import inner membrane translocase, subunit Tim17/22 [Coccomyxa subellipsoidea C-169]